MNTFMLYNINNDKIYVYVCPGDPPRGGNDNNNDNNNDNDNDTNRRRRDPGSARVQGSNTPQGPSPPCSDFCMILTSFLYI